MGKRTRTQRRKQAKKSPLKEIRERHHYPECPAYHGQANACTCSRLARE